MSHVVMLISEIATRNCNKFGGRWPLIHAMAMCQTMGSYTPVRQYTGPAMVGSYPSMPAVSLAPFPSACLEAARSYSPAMSATPISTGCHVQTVHTLPVRQSSAASLSGRVTGPTTPIHTPGRGGKAVATAPTMVPPPAPLLAAQAQEIDFLKKQLEEARGNETRLQEELAAAKSEISRLAEALWKEKQFHAAPAVTAVTTESDLDLPREVPRAVPAMAARGPLVERTAEPFRLKSTERLGRAENRRGSESSEANSAPLSYRKPLRRGASPVIRRPSRDEVEEKLSDYLANSPHCKLEFCRLNQGWYQYRHGTDSSVPQKCIEALGARFEQSIFVGQAQSKATQIPKGQKLNRDVNGLSARRASRASIESKPDADAVALMESVISIGRAHAGMAPVISVQPASPQSSAHGSSSSSSVRGTYGTQWCAWVRLVRCDTAAFRVAGVALGDINLRFVWDCASSTAMHFAAQCYRTDIARLLLAAWACPDACDFTGETPLTVAFGGPRSCLVRLLLEAHADADLVKDDGQSPFPSERLVDIDCAHTAATQEAAKQLCSEGGNNLSVPGTLVSPQTQDVSPRGSKKLVNGLIKLGIN
eukprot:s307_g16.t1